MTGLKCTTANWSLIRLSQKTMASISMWLKTGSVLSRARLTMVMLEGRPSTHYNIHAETMPSSAILLALERLLYNSEVIAYSVHYVKAEGLNNEGYQVILGNDTTNYIIIDLEPDSNYTFYIVANMTRSCDIEHPRRCAPKTTQN